MIALLDVLAFMLLHLCFTIGVEGGYKFAFTIII